MCTWTSLVVQWLRIRLPMQGTRVCSLAQEDSTPQGNYVHVPQLLRLSSRAQAPQQEKPTHNQRVALACSN